MKRGDIEGWWRISFEFLHKHGLTNSVCVTVCASQLESKADCVKVSLGWRWDTQKTKIATIHHKMRTIISNTNARCRGTTADRSPNGFARCTEFANADKNLCMRRCFWMCLFVYVSHSWSLVCMCLCFHITVALLPHRVGSQQCFMAEITWRWWDEPGSVSVPPSQL